MAQSGRKSSKNQSLPIPPPIPKTVTQGKTEIDVNKSAQGVKNTKLNKSPAPFRNDLDDLPVDFSPELNLDDLPDFDDDDDDELDSGEATQVYNDNLATSLGTKANLAMPPLPSRKTQTLTNDQNITRVPEPSNRGNQARIPATNAPTSPNLQPPNAPLTPPNPVVRPGETDVKAGSGMAKAPPRRKLTKDFGPQLSSPAVGRSPGQPSLHELVKLAFDTGCSDIHLGVSELPRMRDRGEMITLDQYPEIDVNTFMSWLREILREEDIQKFKKELEFDGATQYDFARVRINVFDTLRGPALVLRLIPLKILTMDQLRLPPIFRDICDAHKGLILITGPTGSGKSTTLAAMIDYINKEQAKHIITIEDPVEFVHKSHKSLIKQREVGMHTLKFDNALKASLREDPDIILVGEMRDKETVNTALKAAQTGHLVMGTLHTNSAIKTLERIFTLYTAEEQPAMRSAIAESLVGIIAQGLCRTTDGKRAAYHDILINTETVKDYILGNKYEEIGMLMNDGEFDGMITMNKSLFNLYQEGRITEETALERSPTANEMAMMLRGRI